MREKRWETLGKLEADRPRAGDIVASETDEDAESARGHQRPPITGEYSEITGPRQRDPILAMSRLRLAASSYRLARGRTDRVPPVELVRPFENLPELPDDLAEAFRLDEARDPASQAGRLARLSPPADVLRTLDALKALVTAPSDDAARVLITASPCSTPVLSPSCLVGRPCGRAWRARGC